MALTVINNVSSLNAQNNLNRSNSSLNQSLERLSSGLKINRGADGPAALVISETQRAQIAGLGQAIENTEKAVSLVQTAEGAFTEVNSLLVKIRSLAIDSANTGVNDDNALAANQAEITNALHTIDRIVSNTQFGSKKLLDGSAGINANSTNSFLTSLNATSTTQQGDYTLTVGQDGAKGQVQAALSAGTGTHLSNGQNMADDEILTINGEAINLSNGMTNAEVQDTINAYKSVTGVEASLDAAGKLELTATQFGSANGFTVSSNKADSLNGVTGIGDAVTQNTITDTGALVSQQSLNLQLNVTAPDTSFESYDVNGNTITSTTGVSAGLSFTVAASAGNSLLTDATVNGATINVDDDSLTFQIGANAGQTATLQIANSATTALGNGVANNQFSSLNAIDVTSSTGAQDALAVIDDAIDQVTDLRGDLGAFQSNTLESTASNLRLTLENTINAESVIRDTDFAMEIANMTKNQVLVQAGASVLGTANQNPQLVLSLLR